MIYITENRMKYYSVIYEFIATRQTDAAKDFVITYLHDYANNELCANDNISLTTKQKLVLTKLFFDHVN